MCRCRMVMVLDLTDAAQEQDAEKAAAPEEVDVVDGATNNFLNIGLLDIVSHCLNLLGKMWRLRFSGGAEKRSQPIYFFSLIFYKKR